MSEQHGTDGNGEQTTTRDAVVSDIVAQVEDLARIQDHISRVIKNIDINEEWFEDYDEPARANYDLISLVA